MLVAAMHPGASGLQRSMNWATGKSSSFHTATFFHRHTFSLQTTTETVSGDVA